MSKEEKLRNMILERYSNISEFSRAIQLPYTTIRSILERGIYNAKLGNVLKICQGLNISTEDLIGSSELVKERQSVTYQSYPLATPLDFTKEWENLNDTEKINLSGINTGKYADSKDLVAIRMPNESMNRIIPLDSQMIIKKVKIEELIDDDIALFTYKDEFMIKTVIKVDNQFIFRPKSYNPNYTDLVVDATDDALNIHGKVAIYVVEK